MEIISSRVSRVSRVTSFYTHHRDLSGVCLSNLTNPTSCFSRLNMLKFKGFPLEIKVYIK